VVSPYCRYWQLRYWNRCRAQRGLSVGLFVCLSNKLENIYFGVIIIIIIIIIIIRCSYMFLDYCLLQSLNSVDFFLCFSV